MTSIKQLKKNGQDFYPKIASESIILPDGQTLEDRLAAKQNTLISGTNIKTINNQPILGSGNITVNSEEATILELQNLVDGEYTPIQFSREFGCTDGNFLQAVSKEYGYVKIVPTDLFTTAASIYPIVVKKSKNSDISTGWFNGISIIEEDKIIEIVRSYIRDTVKYTISTINKDLSTKQDTLVSGTNIKTINNTSLLGEGNITIESNVWESGTGTNSIQSKNAGCIAWGDNSIAEGYSTRSGISNASKGNGAHSEGFQTWASGDYSHAEGQYTQAQSKASHSEGFLTYATGNYSHAEGEGTNADNVAEHASGKYNYSLTDRTLFSIGNGLSNINRKNTFVVNQDGAVYINGIGNFDGSSDSELTASSLQQVVNQTNMTNVTYQELVNLRNNDELVPGKQYRIIDYVTIVKDNQSYKSAEHPFDIIVTADTTNTLNENAKACLNVNDGYFSNYNCDLNKWELKYSLDNSYKYDWVKTEGGYFVPDEQREYLTNDLDLATCGDWFDEYAYAGTMQWNGNTVYVWNAVSDNLEGWQVLTSVNNYEHNNLVENNFNFSQTPKIIATLVDGEQYAENREDFIVYQFNQSIWVDDFPKRDVSKGVIYYMKDDNGNEASYDFKNIMFNVPTIDGEGYQYDENDGENTWVYTFNYVDEDDGITDGSINGNAVYYNNIIKGSSNNIHELYTNVFLTDSDESACYNNVLGHNCSGNIFSIQNYEFYNNTLNNNCADNIFYGECHNNTLGINCIGITLNTGCNDNVFGNNCNVILLFRNCYSNIFGIGCSNNILGENCYANTFGNYCNFIKTGNSHTIRGYYKLIVIDSGNKYIYLDAVNADSSNYYKNVHICLGVNNTNTYKTITDNNVEQEYETVYSSSNSQTINV